MNAQSIRKLLDAKLNFIDPSHAPTADVFYNSLLRRLGLNDAQLERLYELSGNNIKRLITYLRAQDLMLVTAGNIRAAANNTGRLPSVIFLNEEIRKLDPKFTTLV
jgi:hypothetical protein